MIAAINLGWIIPVVAVIAWAFGYKANPERVRKFVKDHIVDDDPYDNEGHSATRYEPQPGESPIAREARKAAESMEPTKEQIEVARHVAVSGECGDNDCARCPAYPECHTFWPEDGRRYDIRKAAWFRAWLAAHNIPEVEP